MTVRGGSGAPAIEVVDLVRTFERAGREPRHALRGVSLTVQPGEVHGLLGPNGAGKTTLCRILSTMLVPTDGEVRVLGHDVVTATRDVRRLVGVSLGGDRGLYGRLTVEQNLRFWTALFGVGGRRARTRVADAIEVFGLGGRAHDRVETLSRGWKQRVHLARSVVGDPALLVLDEPTAGLDPVAALAVRQLVVSMLDGNRTIVLTTHDMGEAESLCDRVTVLGDGAVLATDRPSALAAARTERYVVALDGPSARAAATDPALVGLTIASSGRDGIEITAADAAALRGVVGALLSRGIHDFRIREHSLEDYYVGLLGDRGIGE